MNRQSIKLGKSMLQRSAWSVRRLYKKSWRFSLRTARNASYRLWKTLPHASEFVLINVTPTFIPKFTRLLELHGEFEPALRLLKKRRITGNLPNRTPALQPRFLTKLERHEDLADWYETHAPMLAVTPLTAQNRDLRMTLFRVGDQLQIEGLRIEILQRALADLHSEDPEAAEAARKVLLEFRIFFPFFDHLFARGAILKWSWIKPATFRKRLSKEISSLVELASRNELRETAAREVHTAIDQGRSPLEIFIPSHFFARWDQKSGGSRQANWHAIRSMYVQMIATIDDLEVPIQPRHQYFLNHATPSQTMPAISFFSHGGSTLNWHMRDVGVQGLISLDPDGYWGHSSLSVQNITDSLLNMDVSSAEIEAAGNDLRDWFRSSGGNKYASGAKDEDLVEIDPNGIFVPLQAPNGLEATERRVEELIELVADYSNATGATVYLRRHPLDKSPLVTSVIKEAEKRSPHCIQSNIAPWKLSSQTAATVSLNSATILQAIAAGRAVFTWGMSDVQSVAQNIGDAKRFRTNMDNVRTGHNPLADLQARFVYFYLRRYLVDVADKDKLGARIKLIHDLSRITSQADVRQSFLDRLFVPEQSDVRLHDLI